MLLVQLKQRATRRRRAKIVRLSARLRIDSASLEVNALALHVRGKLSAKPRSELGRRLVNRDASFLSIICARGRCGVIARDAEEASPKKITEEFPSRRKVRSQLVPSVAPTGSVAPSTLIEDRTSLGGFSILERRPGDSPASADDATSKPSPKKGSRNFLISFKNSGNLNGC